MDNSITYKFIGLIRVNSHTFFEMYVPEIINLTCAICQIDAKYIQTVTPSKNPQSNNINGFFITFRDNFDMFSIEKDKLLSYARFFDYGKVTLSIPKKSTCIELHPNTAIVYTIEVANCKDFISFKKKQQLIYKIELATKTPICQININAKKKCDSLDITFAYLPCISDASVKKILCECLNIDMHNITTNTQIHKETQTDPIEQEVHTIKTIADALVESVFSCLRPKISQNLHWLVDDNCKLQLSTEIICYIVRNYHTDFENKIMPLITSNEQLLSVIFDACSFMCKI